MLIFQGAMRFLVDNVPRDKLAAWKNEQKKVSTVFCAWKDRRQRLICSNCSNFRNPAFKIFPKNKHVVIFCLLQESFLMNFPEKKTSHHGPLQWMEKESIFKCHFCFQVCTLRKWQVFFSTYKPFFAWRLGAIRFGRCMGECHARHLDKCNKTRPTARSERPVVFSFFFNGPAWGTSWVAGWLFPIGGLGSGHPPQLPPKHSGWGIRVICPDEDVWDKLDQSTTYEFAQF